MSGETKPVMPLATKLSRIAQRSKSNPKEKWKFLMPLFRREYLIECFYELDGSKAVGVDQKTKDDYQVKLIENIDSLVERMKTMSYRPLPVKEVLIPKADGGKRPLGISCIEDKVVQLLYAKILNAIYEQIFLDVSYGFREGRNCHQAVSSIIEFNYKERCEEVIDADIKNYFGSIEHQKLIAILEMRIEDKTFLRYVSRMLKAGILKAGILVESATGTAQGSICSPILANIYGHYILDIWFLGEIRPQIKGKASLVRYCDDFVILTTNKCDTEMIMNKLDARLKRGGLELHPEKTRVVSFNKKKFAQGIKQGTFNFLGFTFYIGKAVKGWPLVKVKTMGKRMSKKLKEINDWWREVRCSGRLEDIWKRFNAKLRGYAEYFSVTFNYKWVKVFQDKCTRIAFKWINRRSQRRSYNWLQFRNFLKYNPLPKVKIRHSLIS